MNRVFDTTRGRLAFGSEWAEFPNDKDGHARAKKLTAQVRPRRVARVQAREAFHLGLYRASPELRGNVRSGAVAFAEYAATLGSPDAALLLTVPGMPDRAVVVVVVNGVPAEDRIGDTRELITQLQTSVPSRYGLESLTFFSDKPDALQLVEAQPTTAAEIARIGKGRLAPVGPDLARFALWGGIAAAFAAIAWLAWDNDQALRKSQQASQESAAQRQQRAASLTAEYERSVAAVIAAGGPIAARAGGPIADRALAERSRVAGWLVNEVKCSPQSCTVRYGREWSTNEDFAAGLQDPPAAFGYPLNVSIVERPLGIAATAVQRPWPKSRDFLINGGSLFQTYLDAGLTVSLSAPSAIEVTVAGADAALLAQLRAEAPLAGRWSIAGAAAHAREALARLPENMTLSDLTFTVDAGDAVRFTAKGGFYVARD